MKICFLISQNSALYSICKDALAKVTPYIELRMIGDDAAYQQAAAVHGIALVIVECTKYDRENPAFRAALRKRLHVVQTDAAIPVIFADPKLQTGDEALPDSDTLVISPTASLDKWIQIISRALGVTETRLYHGDIDDIFEDFSIYDAPQVPNILSTEEFLKSAKPLEPHQFDIAISEAWTISNPPESTRRKSSALVQDISFNDDKMIAPAYRKSLVSQRHLKPIQPQFARTEAEKPSKPSLLDRLLKRHKPDTVQPAQSLKRLNSTPPKVPRLIQPPKPPVPKPATQPQQPSNPMLSSERVMPPANATGFNIEIGSIAEASVSVQNDVQAPMLSSEHVMPPEKATGFDIEIGSIAEQNTEAVPEMLDPEDFRPQDTAKFAIGGALKREDTPSAPEMLDPEDFRPQDSAKFAIGGALKREDTPSAPEMLDPEDFRPQDTAKFAIGGAFKREDTASAPEMLNPENFRPQDSAKFAIGGAFKREETASAPEMLDPEDFRPQDSAKFAIGGAFKREETASTPEMLDPEDFRPQDTAKFAIGGAFKREETASAPEMLDPEEFRPQDTAKFAIGGAFKREETTSTPQMLDPEDFRPQDTAKFAIGGAFKREETPSAPEMLDPEDFRPQDSAKFAIGGAFKREETASTPEMLDPEDFRPQDSAKFAIGGAFRRDTTENDAPGMLSENEIRKSFESESRFDFNVGGNFASSSNDANTKRSFAEMFSPEELLASAENLKVPFDFTVYPAGHPGFAEEIDDTSIDDWYEDDDDFLPPFRLEDDDDFSTDLNVSPPQAHPSQDIAQQISAAVEASLTSVLRKLMTEEVLPVIERRIDEKFEALKEHLAAQPLNISKEN